MDLLPAIDLRHGRVVRLRQGDDSRTTEYAGDPLAVAASFAAAGARRIHVVDLDAALGEPPQRALIERLAAALATGGGNGGRAARAGGARASLQLGGGLRDRAAVEWALAAGCERVVLGSLPARDPAAFGELARAFPGRTVPALEVAGGELRVAGWTQAAGSPLAEICARLRGLPCPAVLVTDVERDGMLCGPNLDLAQRIAIDTGLPALLSGGVRSLADLAAAAALPEIAGAVLGRALYEGQIDLPAALAVCSGAAARSWPGEGAAGHPGAPAAASPGEDAAGHPGAPAAASPGEDAAGRPGATAAARSVEKGAAGTGPSGLTRRVIPCLDVAAGRVVK